MERADEVGCCVGHCFYQSASGEGGWVWGLLCKVGENCGLGMRDGWVGRGSAADVDEADFNIVFEYVGADVEEF